MKQVKSSHVSLFIYLFNIVLEVLQLCDFLRDDVLPEHGVRFEDHEGK